MSLKHFHILFVILSFLLSLGLCLWAVAQFLASKNPGLLALSLLAAASAICLALYLPGFLQKMKKAGLA